MYMYIIHLGAVLFSSSLTNASSSSGWMAPSVVNITPYYIQCMKHVCISSNTRIWTCSQKLLIACGGNPLLLRAVSVNSLGSFQSLTKPQNTSLKSLSILTDCVYYDWPDNTIMNELLYLPLRDNSMFDIESTKLPLNRTVNIQCITQPVVWPSSVHYRVSHSNQPDC